MATVYTAERPYTAFARFVSDVLSPPILAVPGLMLVAWCSREPRALGYVSTYFLIGVMAPVLYVVWLLKTGKIDDFNLPRRTDRIRPFTVSVLCGLAAIALLVALEAPADVLAPIVVLLTQTMLLFVISLAWKVSVHTATTTGLVTFAILSLGDPAALLLLALVPLVAWARIYLKRHTIAQTVVGAALGSSCFLVLLPAVERFLR